MIQSDFTNLVTSGKGLHRVTGDSKAGRQFLGQNKNLRNGLQLNTLTQDQVDWNRQVEEKKNKKKIAA